MPSDPVNTILREAYYDQQLLKVDDFQREQNFQAQTRELQNRLLMQHGVLSGLVVVATTAPAGIQILPGIALDALGKVILLADVATLNDAPWAASNGVFSVPPGPVAAESWPAAVEPAEAYGFRPAMVEPAELSTFCAPAPAAPTTFCAPVPAAPTTPVPAVAAAFVTPVPAVAASLVISGSWVLAAPVTVCPAVP